jgi:cation diffusion facilitator family transporter
MMDAHTRRRKANVAMLSVISNTVLVILKLIIGISIRSVSVISESIHSGVDLLASVIAYIAVRISGKPADRDHPFGHGKVENISGTIEAALIFIAAGWIIYEAVKKLVSGEALDNPAWGVAVMFVSAVANIIVSKSLFKVGKDTNSMALLADAWHLKTDVWTSVGVTVGLALIWIGEALFPNFNFHWIDPIAAIAVAMLIIRAAYHLTVEAARDLMDVTLPEEELTWIREHVESLKPVVRAFHELKTRKSGHNRFIEFHLLVDADMSVEESHRITDMITADIEKQYQHSNVTIHIEPCNGDCTVDCEEGCLVEEHDRKNIGSGNNKPSLPVTE